eukprot:4368130-Alexandrium_andersonii.AAC.1
MSASLVGSEMCIRDRASPRPRSRYRGEGVRGAGTPGGWQHGGFRPLGVPVSYTHLTLPTICSV